MLKSTRGSHTSITFTAGTLAAGAKAAATAILAIPAIPATAAPCLLFEARHGSRTLIGVVLHANPTDNYYSRFVMATRLLNWGFRHS